MPVYQYFCDKCQNEIPVNQVDTNHLKLICYSCGQDRYRRNTYIKAITEWFDKAFN